MTGTCGWAGAAGASLGSTEESPEPWAGAAGWLLPELAGATLSITEPDAKPAATDDEVAAKRAAREGRRKRLEEAAVDKRTFPE